MSTDADGSKPEPSRPFRDRRLGRIVILVVVLAIALLVAKSCASRETDVGQDEAIEIAREEIDFEPERTMVRFLPRGVDSRPFWAVSFSLLDTDGNPEYITVVVVNGTTGDVEEIRRGDR
jgi:hypothetical protein